MFDIKEKVLSMKELDEEKEKKISKLQKVEQENNSEKNRNFKIGRVWQYAFHTFFPVSPSQVKLRDALKAFKTSCTYFRDGVSHFCGVAKSTCLSDFFLE